VFSSRFLTTVISFLFFVFFVESATAQSMCRDLFARPAQSEKALSLLKLLKRAKIYENGFCSTNIYSLIQHMDLRHINIDDAEVLFIIPKAGADAFLNPLRLDGKQTEWDFHVVLFYEGKIFDFDFNGALLSPKEYIREMFGVSENEDYGIMVRAIPARDFLADYRDHREVNFRQLYQTNDPLLWTIRDFQWYIEDGMSYPLMPINDLERFLQSF
jgi:N-terminal glutamine amidase